MQLSILIFLGLNFPVNGYGFKLKKVRQTPIRQGSQSKRIPNHQGQRANFLTTLGHKKSLPRFTKLDGHAYRRLPPEIKRNTDATCKIESGDNTGGGTGSLVSKIASDGTAFILTNHHVMNRFSKETPFQAVFLKDEKSQTAKVLEVVAEDKESDSALVLIKFSRAEKKKARGIEPVQFAKKNMTSDMDVYSVGFPQHEFSSDAYRNKNDPGLLLVLPLHKRKTKKASLLEGIFSRSKIAPTIDVLDLLSTRTLQVGAESVSYTHLTLPTTPYV